MPRFSAIKLRNNLGFSYIKNMLKDLLFKQTDCSLTSSFSGPKSSRDLKETGARFSRVPTTFRARKATLKTTTCLFCKAGLLIGCKGNKSKDNCKVSCLETPSFWRYKENYVTRNTPEKFRHFRETGPRSLGSVSRKSRHLLGDIIQLVSSKRKCLEARNFAVTLIFISFTIYETTSFTE